MTLLAFGLNHATAPLTLRERVTIAGAEVPRALADLRLAGADEAAILSTCNRTEVYCSVDLRHHSRPVEWFCGFHRMEDRELAPFLYQHPDSSAVKHVLRVASGLDSMILGEPQVLGQLKDAYQTAVRAGSIGHLLSRLFQHSFRVAKEIRSNTAIGSHPVSVAFAAVRLAHQIFGDLSGRTALLMGAGDTIELAARHLSENGMRRMIVANRTLQRAQELASGYSGYAITLEDVPLHLDEADIIISGTASPEPVLDRDTIRRALRKRRRRPMFIVDVAVPRDIDPAAGELEDVYLYSVDDLRDVIDENKRTRQEAALQAEEIISNQVVHFMEWMKARDAVDTIRSLREHAGRLREEVMADARRRLKRGEDPEQVMQEATRLLTHRLIHSPTAQLRGAAAGEREDLLRAARELFDLGAEPGPGDGLK